MRFSIPCALAISAVVPNALAVITKTTTITDTKTTTITHVYASSTSVQTSLMTSVHAAIETSSASENCTTQTVDMVYVTSTSQMPLVTGTGVSASSGLRPANATMASEAPFPLVTVSVTSGMGVPKSTASNKPVAPSSAPSSSANPTSGGNAGVSMTATQLALTGFVALGASAWTLLC